MDLLTGLTCTTISNPLIASMDATSLLYIAVALVAGLILFLLSQKKKPKERGEYCLEPFHFPTAQFAHSSCIP